MVGVWRGGRHACKLVLVEGCHTSPSSMSRAKELRHECNREGRVVAPTIALDIRHSSLERGF
jgi:hypothetical protein